MLAECLHGGEDEIGTCDEQFFVGQWTCVDSNGQNMGSMACPNT